MKWRAEVKVGIIVTALDKKGVLHGIERAIRQMNHQVKVKEHHIVMLVPLEGKKDE